MRNALQGKIAMVTGASSGIGQAIALALAKSGADVLLVGRNAQRLAIVKSQVEKCGQRALSVRANFADQASIKQLVKTMLAKHRAIDILIHSAGTIELGYMESALARHFDQQYAVNVKAPYLLTQLLLPFLIKSKGHVVFINSTAGLQASAQVSQYAASKHALKAIADSLRAEVNEQGVRVTSIFTGTTATPMQKRLHQQKNKPYNPETLMQPSDIAHMVVSVLTLPTTSEVTDIIMRPMQKPL